MSKNQMKQIEIGIPELVKNANDKSGIPIYANHAQFSIGANEIFIDFFQLGSNPTKSGTAQALYVQRIIIPFGLVKGFVSALANLIARFEKDTGEKIPNSREKDPTDTLDIWK